MTAPSIPSYQEAQFKSLDNLELRGYFAHSRVDSPTIIFCHGKGSSHKNQVIQEVASYLFRNSYNLFLFDFRAHQRSEGKEISFGWYEKNDILGAIEYLKTRDDINPDMIGGFGISMGAAALVFAASGSLDIKACVFEGLYPAWEKMVKFKKGEYFLLPGQKGHVEMVNKIKQRLNIKEDIAPIRYIAQISPRPILLIHGKLDEDVPLDQVLKMFEKAREPKEIWVVENGNHFNCYIKNKEAYQRKVLEFFNKSFGRA